MNQQFQTRFLPEDLDEFESLRNMLLDLGANKDAAEMLVNAVAKGRIEPSKAVEIVKSTAGLREDGVGGGSTTGGGVTNGASFTAGAGEQYAGKKAFKKVEEDAPMLAHGKADISTYTQDGFTKAEGHPKGLTMVQPKDLWGTLPTAMSERLKEMSLQNPGMSEFIGYVHDHPEVVSKLGFRKLENVIDYLEDASVEDWQEIRKELSDLVGGEDIGIYETPIQENYHRFKRETRERPKQDQYHEAIKEVNKKLEEVNRILEFTTRLKEELSEGDQMLEVKTRTAKTMDKLKTKIAEAYKKLKNLN